MYSYCVVMLYRNLLSGPSDVMSSHVTSLPGVRGALQSVRDSVTSSQLHQLLTRLSREISYVILAVGQAEHAVSDGVFVDNG